MNKFKHPFGYALILIALLTAGCASPPPQPEVTAAPQAQAMEKVVPAKSGTKTNVAPAAAMNEAQVIATVDSENSVFFKSGSAEIDTTGELQLRRHADRLKDDPKLRVWLIGYTDNQGSHAYNLAIAQERVNTVYDLLVKFGAPRMQIRHAAMGGEMSHKACRSETCRARMRRVELRYQQP